MLICDSFFRKYKEVIDIECEPDQECVSTFSHAIEFDYRSAHMTHPHTTRAHGE